MGVVKITIEGQSVSTEVNAFLDFLEARFAIVNKATDISDVYTVVWGAVAQYNYMTVNKKIRVIVGSGSSHVWLKDTTNENLRLAIITLE